jgi:mono/diheme cytochrome c family protein
MKIATPMRSLLLMLLVISPVAAQMKAPKDAPVTFVEGESWLNRLNRPLNETRMGYTGRYGPSEPLAEESSRDQADWAFGYSRENVVLKGADLYRLNCRACHGEAGLGAPPEINSLVNPVRATSAALTLARMRQVGMQMSHATAAELAKQAKDALLQRLHEGGQSMPPFHHLREPEIHSLLEYLNQLAGVPNAARQQAGIQESPLRVGEQIVKSTCHICHSADGPNPSPEALLEGAIPPLTTLTTRKTLSEFIQKVTHGATITMGTPPMAYRGRMPVFYYLSEQEAADVYRYLAMYSPRHKQQRDRLAAALQYAGDDPPSGGGRNDGEQSWLPTEPFVIAALLTFVLLMAGFAIGVSQFMQLGVPPKRRVASVKTSAAAAATGGVPEAMSG